MSERDRERERERERERGRETDRKRQRERETEPSSCGVVSYLKKNPHELLRVSSPLTDES